MPSLLPTDEWQPRIGEQVVVVSDKPWASDYVDTAGRPLVLYVAGLNALAAGGVDVAVSDEWPLRPNSLGFGAGLTDGFKVGVPDEPNDLAPYLAMQAVRPSDGVVEALLGPEGDDGTLGRFGWLSAFMNDLKAAANLDRDDMVIFALDDPAATWEAIQEIDNLIHDVRQALAATNQESVSE